LASSAAITGQGAPKSTPATTPPRHLVRLWRDTIRVEQMARLRKLQLQPGDEFGQHVWEMAHELWGQLPEHARIDLPSSRVFARILGLMRTCGTLKTGKLKRLEISAKEMAELVGYSKATVEAALRWLGSGPIEYQGAQLSRGLGILHRGRRTAWAILDGSMRRIYRTSRIVLTTVGQFLVGLATDDAQTKQQRRAAAQAKRKASVPLAASEPPPPPREQEFIEGQSTDAPPASEVKPSGDVGKFWLKKIQHDLG